MPASVAALFKSSVVCRLGQELYKQQQNDHSSDGDAPDAPAATSQAADSAAAPPPTAPPAQSSQEPLVHPAPGLFGFAKDPRARHEQAWVERGAAQ
eukprot:5338048-Pleurochrysis_carterae.AAC.1